MTIDILKQKAKGLISNKWLIIAIYVLFTIAVSLQSLSTGTKTYYEGCPEYKNGIGSNNILNSIL